MAVAFANQTATQNAAAASHVVTYASVAGNCLTACIALRTGSTQSVSSVTDSASNTWTKGPVGFVSGSNTRIEIWYVLNAAAVSNITITPTVSMAASITIAEFSGVAQASAGDGSNNASNTALIDVLTGIAVTANPNDLLIGALCTPTTTTLSGISTGYTSLTGFTATSTLQGIRAAYQVVLVPGSYQVDFTMSGATTAGGAILALMAQTGLNTAQRGIW